jgi:uncharacterized membrane protein
VYHITLFPGLIWDVFLLLAPYEYHTEFFGNANSIALAKTFKMSPNLFMKCFLVRSYQQKKTKKVSLMTLFDGSLWMQVCDQEDESPHHCSPQCCAWKM